MHVHLRSASACDVSSPRRLTSRGALLVFAALASGACGSQTNAPGVNEAPQPASRRAPPVAMPTASASPAPDARYASPTLALAGARICTFDTPVEIAAVDATPGSLSELVSAMAFGRSGGLLVWQGPDDDIRAWARPLDHDGRPTAPAVAFATPDSFIIEQIVAFEGGFAVLYSIPDARPLRETHYLQAFGPKGEPRRGPVTLEMEDFRWNKVSEAAKNRFIVFGGPNPRIGRQGSRVLLITIDAEGGVEQKKLDFPISAPATESPAVAIALDEKRWAVTVRVAKEEPGAMFVFGGQATTPIDPSGGKSPKGPAGGTESLIVDGVLSPIRADAAVNQGPASAEDRHQIAWKGDELAVTWSVPEQGGKRPRFGRLSRDGQLHAETTSEGEKAIRAAFEEQVSVIFDGSSHAGVLLRETRWGAPVGAAIPLVGALPDAEVGIFNLDVSWSGDRFVIAYGPNVHGTVRLRVVGMHCDGKGKAP